jgi:hypothetical protein
MTFLFGLLGLAGLFVALVLVASGASWWVARLVGAPGFQLFDVERPSSSLTKELALRSAGALAPLVLLVMVFAGVLLVAGDRVSTTTVNVLPGSARDAGMRNGDRVVEIDGSSVGSWEELRSHFQTPNEKHEIVVERGGERAPLLVTANSSGRIGIESQLQPRPVGWTNALARGAAEPFKIVAATVSAALRPPEKVELAGPVGMVRETAKFTSGGLAATLWFLALIGSYFWPAFPLAHVLDAATLPRFRRTHSLRRSDDASPAVPTTLRVARLLRLFHALLIITLTALVLVGVLELMSIRLGSALVLPLVWLSPSLLPVTWHLANLLWGRAAAALTVLSFCVPCLNLAALLFVAIRAREYLNEKGLANAGIVPPAA